MCYQAERTLTDFGDKIASDLRTRIESALRETKTAVPARDADEARSRAEDLKAALQEVGAAMYTPSSAGTTEGATDARKREDDQAGFYL